MGDRGQDLAHALSYMCTCSSTFSVIFVSHAFQLPPSPALSRLVPFHGAPYDARFGCVTTTRTRAGLVSNFGVWCSPGGVGHDAEVGASTPLLQPGIHGLFEPLRVRADERRGQSSALPSRALPWYRVNPFFFRGTNVEEPENCERLRDVFLCNVRVLVRDGYMCR